MTHITIPSNSSGLYDYVLPLITNINDIENDDNLKDNLHNKVKSS